MILTRQTVQVHPNVIPLQFSAQKSTIYIIKNLKYFIKTNLFRLTDSKVGRYIVAAESIQCNEYIISEKSFSMVAIRDESSEIPTIHICGHCCKSIIGGTLVSCSDCQNISYCSEDCLQTDYVHVHEFECAGFKKDLWYELGISHLALHIMLTGVRELFQRKESENSLWLSTPNGWNDMIKYSKETNGFSYGDVLSLESYTEKINGPDTMRYILVNIFFNFSIDLKCNVYYF